jgi:hypothetical protein
MEGRRVKVLSDKGQEDENTRTHSAESYVDVG